MKFKKGDVVRCVNAKHADLTVGKEYKVLLGEESGVFIKNDKGIEVYYNNYRNGFILAGESPVIDITKTYQTRDGRPVELYMIRNEGVYPVHGAIFDHTEWVVDSWTSEGAHVFNRRDDTDLVEVKPRITKTYWANIYDGSQPYGSRLHKTRQKADELADDSRLACIEIKIDCEEGEGLD